jgi:hypothetical protein
VTLAQLIADALRASLRRRANGEQHERVRLITMQGTGTRPDHPAVCPHPFDSICANDL